MDTVPHLVVNSYSKISFFLLIIEGMDTTLEKGQLNLSFLEVAEEDMGVMDDPTEVTVLMEVVDTMEEVIDLMEVTKAMEVTEAITDEKTNFENQVTRLMLLK